MEQDVRNAIDKVEFPLFVKLVISQASMGISAKSICRTYEEAITQCQEIFKNEASAGGVYIEKFLAGREFTVLVAGDKTRGTTVYLPVEAVFNEALSNDDKILDFKTYWAGYDEMGAMPKPEDCHVRWQAAPEEIRQTLIDLCRDSYLACFGTGYGRVDIRSNLKDVTDPNFKVYALEVNAQCGLSFDPMTTQMGAILKLENVSPSNFINTVLNYARAPALTSHKD